MPDDKYKVSEVSKTDVEISDVKAVAEHTNLAGKWWSGKKAGGDTVDICSIVEVSLAEEVAGKQIVSYLDLTIAHMVLQMTL
jgi:hypothetical protein